MFVNRIILSVNRGKKIGSQMKMNSDSGAETAAPSKICSPFWQKNKIEKQQEIYINECGNDEFFHQQ